MRGIYLVCISRLIIFVFSASPTQTNPSHTHTHIGVLNPEDDIDFKVTPYSARGPVGDFATKPDVVAPGMMVHSAKASRSEFHEETCALESYGGTSMSAPAISGAAALMRQYFSKGILADYLKAEGHCGDGDGESENGVYGEAGLCEPFEPSGYLLKAVLINSAVWLGNMQSVSYGELAIWGARGLINELG